MTLVESPTYVPMTATEREQFERDGYLIIPGALTDGEVEIARASLMRAYVEAEQAGTLGKHRSLHATSAFTVCPDLAFLLDHRRIFGYVWSTLGWNVHIYHSHVDVHPPVGERPPAFWHWHQDG